MADQCAKVTLAFDNNDYYMYRNGESMVVGRLAGTLWSGCRPVVFDAGANDGEWSLMVLATKRGIDLHVFEIVPDTYRILQRNLREYLDGGAGIVLNEIGLCSDEREIEVWSSYGSNSAGVMPHPDARDNACITARVTTGDAYLAASGVEKIDYLKIDVEGAGYNVLRGFAGALAGGRIAMLQFEYGPYATALETLRPGNFPAVAPGIENPFLR
ncbi:FkbM family methyltransferase [bacterium]|nr:FkbM family methyltransferase [bacterium]MBU1072565.1 FkbM family methyltransferase [bacterium]MBU1675439.1 FkbM family methyltransferase [bacterium]